MPIQKRKLRSDVDLLQPRRSKEDVVSDTSVYEARIYQEQLATEFTRQEAATEELNYWKRRRELLEADAASPTRTGQP
jgi:hypothetical protein